MNYREWNTDNDNLFTELARLDQDGVISSVGVVGLSMIYESMFGDRQVPKPLVKYSKVQIALLLESMFGAKWENIYIADLDSLGAGVEREKIITETYINSGTKSINNNSLDQTTAFNDSDFIDDSNSDNTTNEIADKTNTHEFKEIIKSNDTFDKQTKMMDNKNIAITICIDISKVIGLSIY